MIKPRRVPDADRAHITALLDRIRRAERESPELVWAAAEARRTGALPPARS